MKSLSFSSRLAIGLLVLAGFGAASGKAQSSDDSVGVSVRIWGRAAQNRSAEPGEFWIGLAAMPSAAYPSGSFSAGWMSPSLVNNTPFPNPVEPATVKLMPGKIYTVSLDAVSTSSFTFYAAAPQGYQVEIGGSARQNYGVTTASSYSGTVTLRIAAPGELSGRAGVASSLVSGRIFWQVALGALRNGSSAGALTLANPGLDASFDAVATPAGLQYAAPSSEIQVYRDPSTSNLRQIMANQAIVDLAAIDGSSYSIKFYNISQKTGSTFPYGFSGTPYVTYTVAKTATTSLQITSQTSARTAVTTLQRTGNAIPYSWTLQDWHTSGQNALVEEQRDGGGTAGDRTESRYVRLPGQANTTAVAKTFHAYAWGEELMQITPGSGGTAPVTTALDYYTDSSQSGSYAFLKSSTSTGGSWEAYDYDNTNILKVGMVATKYRPFHNLPASITLDASQGEVTSFQYTGDAFGMLTRPTQILTKVNGTVTGQSAISYASSLFSGSTTLYIVTATRTDSTSTSAALTSVTKYFQEDAGIRADPTTGLPNVGEEFYRGQIYSSEGPDHVKTSFAYQRGDFDGTNFSPNSGGLASRTAAIIGSASSGTSYSSYGGFAIDPVGLIDKKSTLQVTIRDERALPRRTETYVWSGGNWQLLTYVNCLYDAAGRLTDRVASSSGSSSSDSYGAEFTGDQLTAETDPSGIRNTYTYDAAGRVDTVTKATVGAISALATKFTYDAEDRVTQQTVGYGLSESLVSSRMYDTAGRIVSESSPGPNGALTTSYSYDVASRQVTVTLPSGGTRIETYFADGSPQQITGTGVVPQYFTAEIQTGGVRYGKANFGTASSSRLRETWSDWLGRGTTSSRPGFSGTSRPAVVEQATYDPSTGRLTKTTRTGYADTLYGYDELSQPTRSGLDLGGTAGALDLGGPDRVADADQYFENMSSVWWVTKISKTYPTTGSSTPLTISTSRQQVTGFTGNVRANTVSTDLDGNTTTRTVSVDRTAATTTATITTSGIANTQSETYVNGLLTSATGVDGITYTTAYDALSRRSTMTAPRTGTSTTHFKTGSTFVDYVTDAAGKNVATYTYDSAGRVVSVKDAENYYTYTSYNSLDQVVRRWGSGTYAVEFAYNSYGEKIAQRTFHGTSIDFTGTSWPLGDSGIDSHGNPDPSGWTSGDKTSWAYDGPSGLLTSKTDAAGKSVTYTYNDRGQTATRTWARHVGNNPANPLLTSTYAYYSGTGEPSGVTYNDTGEANPSSPVSYAYTRAGQLDTVTDGTAGTRSFVYNSSQPLRLDALSLSGFYSGRVLTRNYDGIYRPNGFQLGDTSRGLAADLTQTHGYDGTTGRFSSLSTVNSQLSNSFTYGYETSASLVKTLTAGSFTVTRTFEAHRNLLTAIDTKWGAASRTRYDYTYNDRALRDSIKQSGDVFADFGGSTYYRPVYNGRGELVDSADYLGEDASSTSSPQLSGRHFAYIYDNLGNRTSASRTGTAGTPDHFTPNNLNQYASRENNVAHAAGTAQSASVIAASGSNGAGFSAIARQGRYWDAQANLANAGGPATSVFTITATLAGSPTLIRTDATHTAYLAAALQSFAYDDDGNLTGDGVWNYNYDAENRLISMTTTSAAIGAGFPNRALEFKYDYLGRRVQKRSVNATAGTDVYRRYLYDGDNLVAEFDATATTCSTLLRSYTWGLDLAGSLSATGGVGALVQIHDYAGSGTDYLPTYDGNGNVAALLKASDGTVAAAYEYSPFGELLRCDGSYAKSNPFRFSTKFTDDESGLVYYGARYYSPSLGRFINRDPIAEQGGLNLYGFCGNDSINNTDYLGYSWLSRLLHSASRITHQITRALLPIRSLRSMDRRLQTWENNHQQELKIAAAIVAAIVTYGAASEWAAAQMTSSIANSAYLAAAGGPMAGMAAGSAAVAAASTEIAVVSGIVGGAAAGAVSGVIMTGTVKGTLQGAAAGAIMGGIGGYYGKTWSLARVGVTATGGGVASEISGGRFRDGALIAGSIAGLTYLNHLAREYEWAHSPPEAKTGVSSGLDDDGYKLGGGRPKLTYDQNGNAILTRDIAPFGGDQGSNPGRFILPEKSAAAWYSSGSLRDIVVESFAGVHDFLGHPWTYNAAGYQNVSGSLFGGAITRALGIGTANVVANVMTAVDIPLAAPFAIAPHLMYFGNLDPQR